ncbi:NAD-P-binding protein [Rickenella mellea]|uniref:NAD-P-binding protein n=1 Tax=Rickenella mellea TaxID=50990 RepID=A0A4Y7QIJ3_9AGAM|nr:NAD-P-binding protein [Rickenella mellea]
MFPFSSDAYDSVQITGATGFVGSHILHQALEAGHSVRITTRPAKFEEVKKRLGQNVDVVSVADAATGDYTQALKGVDAIIHAAAPLPMKTGPEALMDGAINGAKNILRQALAVGVHKIVITSSYVTSKHDPALLLSDHVFTDKEWNPATMEEALDETRNIYWVYDAAKTLAERAIWQFADEHPEMDITTINPPMIFGPFAPEFHTIKGDINSLTTMGVFYQNVLLSSGKKLPARQTEAEPINVDVRDVARAHVLALHSPPTREVGRKRLLIGGTNFSWKDAVEHLAEVRPELRARLPDTSEALKTKIAKIDTSRLAEVLGMPNYMDWKKTVEDAADALIELEKTWAQ